MAKVIRKELEAKLAALGGEEWDSMSEGSVSGDEAGAQPDGELKPPPLPLRAQKKKKGAKKGKAAGASVVPVGPAGEPSGVVYVGHIPHGFYEEAMNGFFKQFGDVIRVRISRSKKSARCKARCVDVALAFCLLEGIRFRCSGSVVCTSIVRVLAYVTAAVVQLYVRTTYTPDGRRCRFSDARLKKPLGT